MDLLIDIYCIGFDAIDIEILTICSINSTPQAPCYYRFNIVIIKDGYLLTVKSVKNFKMGF